VPPAKTWDLYTERRRWILLGVLFLVTTSSYIDKNIIGVLLQPIKEEFHVSDTMLGLLSGLSFAMFYATLGIPVARWADRGDRRLIISVSLAVWSVMTAICGLAPTFWLLAAARIGVGAGEAGAIPPGQSLVADYFPPERRGKALGGFMMSSMAGYVMGVVVGGQLAQAYGWRAAFLAVGIPGILLAVIARLLLDEPRNTPAFAIAAGEVEPLRASYRALMAKPSFVNILIGMVLYFLIAYGAFVFVIALMIRTHGISVGKASALFGVVSTVGALVGNAVGGGMADRLARKDPAWFARFAGLGLIAAFFAYEIAFLMPTLTLFVAALMVGGVLLTGPVPSMFAALHLVCGSKRRAMSVAIIFFFANLIGLGLGPIIAGGLSDHFAKTVGPAEGLRYAMMLVMVIFLPCGYYLLKAARTLVADQEA
jgi:MFS family permease